ncbi:hypothetical protein ONZ51_g2599 [Trametes cubensis]|uniref:Uncharacterized protein n=1 Tax=Trametes cubensis TaxID=1111947 RepID=A0AAD7TZF4_9APHY|nr:hypothetical protein ONZ51_g2599 [Trametes cubensis]
MYFSTAFYTASVLGTMFMSRAAVVASPAAIAFSGKPVGFIMSDAEMAHWLATTDAELNFVGARSSPLEPRSAQNTFLVYCTERIGNACGGSCTVYNGGAACIDAPGTECMAASLDVGFCDKESCDGNCSSLSLCGTFLNGGYCFTPGTQSIVVSPL